MSSTSPARGPCPASPAGGSGFRPCTAHGRRCAARGTHERPSSSRRPAGWGWRRRTPASAGAAGLASARRGRESRPLRRTGLAQWRTSYRACRPWDESSRSDRQCSVRDTTGSPTTTSSSARLPVCGQPNPRVARVSKNGSRRGKWYIRDVPDGSVRRTGCLLFLVLMTRANGLGGTTVDRRSISGRRRVSSTARIRTDGPPPPRGAGATSAADPPAQPWHRNGGRGLRPRAESDCGFVARRCRGGQRPNRLARKRPGKASRAGDHLGGSRSGLHPR